MDVNEKIYKSSKVLYGITWYKVREKNSNINLFLKELRNGDESNFLVKRHHPKDGQFWGLATYSQIKNMLKKNVYLYEMLIEESFKKVYFDIDSKTDTLDQCKEKILEEFPNANFQISGYRTQEKCSFHIVLSNYYVKNPLVIKRFCSQHSNLGFDTCVYGRNNLFKCINQSKPKADAPIQAYLEGSTEFSKHLVLSDFDDDAQEITSEQALLFEREERPSRIKEDRVSKSEKPIDLLNEINSKNIDYELPDDFDYINAFSKDKLKAIPLNNRDDTRGTLNHMVIWNVMVWCKNEGMKFEDFWGWCKEKEDTESRKMRYLDYWGAADNYNKSESYINTILMRFYPFLKENDYRKKFRLLNTIEPTKVVEEDFLSNEHISKGIKISYLNIRMGGNKTGAVIDFLKELPKEASILFITPRIALSADILGRLKRNGLEFENYKNIKFKANLWTKDRLICSVQSLHYLADKIYDYVIIDEIETVWPSFSGDASTHREHVNSNWMILLRMVETCKKAIIMDALMSTKTLKIFGQGEIVSLNRQQEPRTYIKYKPNDNGIKKWLNTIFDSLKNGEKIIIFMPYKDRSSSSSKTRHELIGIFQLVKWICKEFKLVEGVDVIGYFSEAKKEKEELVNIEEVWRRARVIVANTCISVGNNYSGQDFDKVYAYFSQWVSTNDFLQFLYRVRNPKDKVMRIYYEKGIIQTDKFCRHKIFIENEKFKYLKAGFLIEDRTEPLQKLEVLMKKLNIHEEDIDIDSISVNLPSLSLNFNEFMINYKDIPEINKEQFKKIGSDMYTGFSSLLERFSFEKYKQRRYFKEEIPETILEIFWKVGDNIIKGLREITNNDNHLLNKILNELGHPEFLKFIESYTIGELSTLKVPKCITNDEIKKNIRLKHEINNRNIILICRIINAIFGKKILGIVLNGKTYDRILVNDRFEEKKKSVYKYAFENIPYSSTDSIEFIQLCKYYKQYSKKYNKFEENNETCQIEDEVECLIEDEFECLIEDEFGLTNEDISVLNER